MNIETRNTLRNETMDKLMTAFPTAQKVSGGIAFLSDTLDDETGKYFPVEIKISIKNTADTNRAPAYDLDAAVAEYANKPGRRAADPEKAKEAAAKKEAAAARKEKYLGILHAWLAKNDMKEMTATEVHDAIPEFANEQVMYVGNLLKGLVDAGELVCSVNEKRKKFYSK